MEYIRKIYITLVVLFLSSCSVIGQRDNSIQLSNDQEELVSRDFVTAISRLRGFSPRETTVQFHNPSTTFSSELHDAMRGAGYGLQILSSEEYGDKHVSYASEQFETSDGTTVAYEVTVGRVKLGREYEIRAGRVFPIAALSIKGATSKDAGTVDNSIFRVGDSSDEWSEVGISSSPAEIENNNKSILINGDIGNLKPEFEAPTAPKRNLAELGRSNYSTLFGLYEQSRQEVLIFPNDSLVLGNSNKKVIASIASQFDPATDIISVIGCSHGSTNIDNGNSLLANGRASRVKEELIMSSIAAEKILDEGCWADRKHNGLPARGVVLTLRSNIKRG